MTQLGAEKELLAFADRLENKITGIGPGYIVSVDAKPIVWQEIAKALRLSASRQQPVAWREALQWIYDHDRAVYQDCDPLTGSEIIEVTREQTIVRGPYAMRAKAALASPASPPPEKYDVAFHENILDKLGAAPSPEARAPHHSLIAKAVRSGFDKHNLSARYELVNSIADEVCALDAGRRDHE